MFMVFVERHSLWLLRLVSVCCWLLLMVSVETHSRLLSLVNGCCLPLSIVSVGGHTRWLRWLVSVVMLDVVGVCGETQSVVVVVG